MIRKILLAGASALAVTATAAKADTWTTPSATPYTWTATANELVRVEVWGAQGGASSANLAGQTFQGGAGAGAYSYFFARKNQPLYVWVGEQGHAGTNGGGGGGGASGVGQNLTDTFGPDGSLLIAGGGGGAGLFGNGDAGAPFSAGGYATDGFGDYGAGHGGTFLGDPGGYGYGGAGGGGEFFAPPGFYGGVGHYFGGAGGLAASNLFGNGYAGGAGGFGWSGGGGAYTGGGGGGGITGAGGGGLFGSPSSFQGAGGGGGGAFSPVGAYGYGYGGLAGGQLGDGKVSIDVIRTFVPEPEEWMLLLMGVFSVGYLLRRDRERLARAGVA
jgi:hypothetical protein